MDKERYKSEHLKCPHCGYKHYAGVQKKKKNRYSPNYTVSCSYCSKKFNYVPLENGLYLIEI